jgi:uncharacterized protein (TIGR02118 family)
VKTGYPAAMYILTVTYPRSEGATFDFDYFRQTHLPEVGKAFGPFGLGYASVLRGEESLDGTTPAFFAVTILSFREEQGARDAVASDGARELVADIANFTTVTPIMQFNTAVP